MFATPGEDYHSSLLDYFNADERFDEVNYYDCHDGTPEPEEFLYHDVVITGGLSNYLEPVLFGDRLADYVDQGSYVMTCSSLTQWPGGSPGGRWHDDGYCPYYSENPNPLEGYEDLIIDDSGHEIFNGVSGLWKCYWRADTILRDSAVELAHFADAGGVAVSMAENVAATNYTPHIGHRWTGDGFLVMANAACYPAGYSEVREASWGQIKAEFD
ncbi:hypothetical protein KAU45_09070 [bacterium]|nr:hypothetical protein [bacterium]